MNKQFIGNDFSQKSSNVDRLTADQVETASDLHMPLCMKVSLSLSNSWAVTVIRISPTLIEPAHQSEERSQTQALG
jgi:hypothetical protein